MARDATRLRTADLRAVYLLLGECCELGADPLVWRRHLLQRLNQLFGATASVAVEAGLAPQTDGCPFGPWVSNAVNVDHLSEAGRDILVRCFREMPVEHNPLGASILADCQPGLPMAATRRERVPNREWERSRLMSDYFGPLGWNDMTIACLTEPTRLRLLNFSRENGEQPFEPRMATMLALLLSELALIPATRLANFGTPSLLELPERLRQVLVALARGDSEQQVAAALGLTRNTVHVYVRRLFARFGVTSRSELLMKAARQLHALEISGTLSNDYWLYQPPTNGGATRKSAS